MSDRRIEKPQALAALYSIGGTSRHRPVTSPVLNMVIQSMNGAKAMEAIQVPQVNNNGDRAETLIEGYSEAAQALRNAIEKMRQTTPHGRNFQTLRPDALAIAIGQHSARVLDLGRILKEIEHLAFEVSKQQR